MSKIFHIPTASCADGNFSAHISFSAAIYWPADLKIYIHCVHSASLGRAFCAFWQTQHTQFNIGRCAAIRLKSPIRRGRVRGRGGGGDQRQNKPSENQPALVRRRTYVNVLICGQHRQDVWADRVARFGLFEANKQISLPGFKSIKL